MKTNALFEECLKGVSPSTKEEVSLNIDIANRISDMIKERNMTQRDLAYLLDKKESEISRWLTGSYGFTTKTLARISSALGERVVDINRESEENVLQIQPTKRCIIVANRRYSDRGRFQYNYAENNHLSLKFS